MKKFFLPPAVATGDIVSGSWQVKLITVSWELDV
jgi:hypothetical protein